MSETHLTILDLETWEDAGPEWRTRIRPMKNFSPLYEVNPEINKLVSFWHFGDISRLKVDAVINRLNDDLITGGSIFNLISEKAGLELNQRLSEIENCGPYETFITSGYKFPSKNIIHTIGPTGEDPVELENILDSILNHIDGINIRTLGITPFYIENNGFSLSHATQIVLRIIRDFLENPNNRLKIDRFIFIATIPQNFSVYIKLFHLFFPLGGNNDLDDNQEEEEEEETNFSESFDEEAEFDIENSQIHSNSDTNGSEPEPHELKNYYSTTVLVA